jgi:hypothetical protein
LTLFARCLARADDADRFFFIFQPSNRINHKKDSPRNGEAYPGRPPFCKGVLKIIPVQSGPSGSLKMVAASSKETPCFLRLPMALRASQENTLTYIR